MILVLFLTAFAAARLIALPEPLGVDQGIFATAGWALGRGLMLYRDVWDQKPPGIHLVYFAGFAVAGAHARTVLLLDTAAATAACALVFALGCRLHSRACGWWAAVMFAIGTYPAFERYYGGFLERAVPETFIMALAAGAAYVTAVRRYALMGLLVGAAAAFKPTALIYWPAFLAFAWIVDRARFSRALVASASTLLLPWILLGAWLWRAHALGDAWTAIVVYNRAYVASGAGWLVLPDRLAHEVWRLVKTDPLWFVGAVAAVASGRRVATLAGGAWRAATRQDPRGGGEAPAGAVALFAILWLAAVVCAVAANGVRMYATYFLPAGPPLALLAGSFFAEHPVTLAAFRRARWRPALSAAVLVIAAAIAIRSHAPDRLRRYVGADVAQLRGAADRSSYLELFGGYGNGRGYSARANAELSAYLEAHTSAEDRVYIFGMAPGVYFAAKRLPADRFVWTYPGVVPFAGRADFTPEALARDLSRAAPRYLVLERNNRDSATGWRIEDVYASPPVRAVLDRYSRETVIEDFTVLARSLK